MSNDTVDSQNDTDHLFRLYGLFINSYGRFIHIIRLILKDIRSIIMVIRLIIKSIRTIIYTYTVNYFNTVDLINRITDY